MKRFNRDDLALVFAVALCLGVLYLLGTISEELDLLPDAKKFYERVFAVDIQFRDIGDRLNAVEKRLK